MAELIKIPFGIWTRMGSRKHVLYGGAHRCNLANMIQLSMCGGDAALCRISWTTCCLTHLFFRIYFRWDWVSQLKTFSDNMEQDFYRPDFLPVTEPIVSNHWREVITLMLTRDSPTWPHPFLALCKLRGVLHPFAYLHRILLHLSFFLHFFFTYLFLWEQTHSVSRPVVLRGDQTWAFSAVCGHPM